MENKTIYISADVGSWQSMRFEEAWLFGAISLRLNRV
jgi:hypothetical protein